jgi:hypothetical protein
MIQYSKLAQLLQGLESGFRRNWPEPDPNNYPSHICIRPKDYRQFFALSNHTFGRSEPLPVVVTLGINYTQKKVQIPDQSRCKPRHLQVPPHVEDQMGSFKSSVAAVLKSFNESSSIWKGATLCSSALDAPLLQDQSGSPKEYHLVLTNLSPWITKQGWSDIAKKYGRNVTAQLLTARSLGGIAGSGGIVPYSFEHVKELKERLDLEKCPPEVWIGHGINNVWEHFVILMEQVCIKKWMLAWNLSYPTPPRFFPRAKGFVDEVARELQVGPWVVGEELEE